MTSFPAAVLVTLSGTHSPDLPATGPVQLSVHELGSGGRRADGSSRPAVVFLHGFPELAYSWRHQLPAVADAGFRAVAMDQRGYGGSSSPADPAAFSIDHLCGDLVDLLDALEVEQAVFVGHDWGGFVAWAMPALFPARCAGVVGVCTPYTPFPGTRYLRSLFEHDDDMYMLWFQQPEVPEQTMDPRARQVFEVMFRGAVDPAVLATLGAGREGGGMTFNPFRDLDAVPDVGRPLLDEHELDVFARTFERTGFGGGVNWYRNVDANGAAHREVGTMPLDLPCLMLAAEWDPALPPSLCDGMPDVLSDLELHVVPQAGHWLPQEAPDHVNRLLLDWLVRRFA
ncbi:MAG: alpha/beta fold hydrolase [Actinomycetes bacterium]